MLSTAIRTTSEEYGAFLASAEHSFDLFGRAQRKFQQDLQSQVIDPLNAWIMTDYARMNDAIEKLHERKWDVDKAKEQSAKNPDDPRYVLLVEQTAREFDRQMDTVKAELIKLSDVRKQHARVFANFLFSLTEYTGAVRSALQAPCKS